VPHRVVYEAARGAIWPSATATGRGNGIPGRALAMDPVVVTHEMGFASKVANRVVFMDEGEIMEDAETETFFNNPKSERAKLFLSKILHHV